MTPGGGRIQTLVIRSGGQTGVDRAALETATALGLRYCGWCPKGGWAEDAPIPPGIRANYPLLTETPSAEPEQRTAWNVRDSDATLLLITDGSSSSPGSELTRVCADLIFLRPLRVVCVTDARAVDEAGRWVADLVAAAAPDVLVLNVAGPRASEVPGIEREASLVLRRILAPSLA